MCGIVGDIFVDSRLGFPGYGVSRPASKEHAKAVMDSQGDSSLGRTVRDAVVMHPPGINKPHYSRSGYKCSSK